ncbi:hypothetical protein EBU99_10240, partial [bacterium]|nr:hypothetical protein [bacterium]
MKILGREFNFTKNPWTKKALLIAALGVTIFAFGKVLSQQKEANDARGEVAALKENKDVVAIPDWDAVFYFCSYGKDETATNICYEDPLRKKESLRLPLENFANPTLSFVVNGKNESRPANTVWLQRELKPDEKQLLQSSKDWMLILPRQIHRATFLGENMPAPVVSYGKGADVSFGLTGEQLLKSGRLDLVVNYKQLTTFGPLELEPVLAKPEAAMRYMGIFSKQLGAASLSKQLLVGLPLVICAIAIVLDQSLPMLFLAAFAALRAAHTYFSFRSESGTLSFAENLTSYAALGASMAF